MGGADTKFGQFNGFCNELFSLFKFTMQSEQKLDIAITRNASRRKKCSITGRVPEDARGAFEHIN